MGETNSSSVAHVDYDISPLSRVKYRNPRATEGESIFIYYSCLLDMIHLMFNATFNNISVILWQSVLLVEETGEPGENY